MPPVALAITASRFTPARSSQATLPNGRILLTLHVALLNVTDHPAPYDYSRFVLRGHPSGTVAQPRLIPLLIDTLLLDTLAPGGNGNGDLAFYVALSDRNFTLSYPLEGHKPVVIAIR